MCAVPDCLSVVLCKSMCSTHYHKQHKYGTATFKPYFDLELSERLKGKLRIDEVTGCILYVVQRKRKHVRIMYKGKKHGLHRLIWQIENGDIPVKMFVRHRCNRGNCINLNHLQLGTSQENSKDEEYRYYKALILMEATMRCPSKITTVLDEETFCVDVFVNGKIIQTLEEAQHLNNDGELSTQDFWKEVL